MPGVDRPAHGPWIPEKESITLSLASCLARAVRDRWIWTCALLTLLKLWLVGAQTLHAIAPTAADDQLFLANAVSILRGEWLGPLTDLTLVKGPVYPLWLALSHLTGARLLLAQAFLYAVACAVLARGLRPAIPHRSRRALLYLAVLFNPATWSDGPATRVVREGIYPSLTILLLGFAMGGVLRLRDAPRRAALWAAAAGFTGALLVMTREEGVWLAPSVAIIAFLGLAHARHSVRRAGLASIATATLAYTIPTMGIASLNWKHYGLFETCETRTGYYRSAYGALTRVKTAKWNPHVPVPREARSKLFEVSPAFREIGPFIERSAAAWTSNGCKAFGVCDDIAGGWFMWAFRDAVNKAGKYQDGQLARAWYERLTREVDDACRSGRLECVPARSNWMPPWRGEYLSPLLSALGRATVFAATFSDVTPYPSAPEGAEADLAWFERISNERLPRRLVQMQGVVVSRAGEATAVVVDRFGAPAKASIQRTSVTAAETNATDTARSTRFAVSTECVTGCRLMLLTTNGWGLGVPLSEGSRAGGDAALTWTTEDFHRGVAASQDEASRKLRLAVLAGITRAYALAIPALLVVAVALLLSRVARAVRARTYPLASLLALALLAGVAVRLLVLALIDVNSFPAITVLYMSPAYGLLIAFVALVLVGRPELPALTAPPRDAMDGSPELLRHG